MKYGTSIDHDPQGRPPTWITIQEPPSLTLSQDYRPLREKIMAAGKLLVIPNDFPISFLFKRLEQLEQDFMLTGSYT